MRNSKTLYYLLSAVFAVVALITAVHEGFDPGEYLATAALLFGAAAMAVLGTRFQPDSK